MNFLNECKTFILDLGFPVFVALYLLIFFDRTIKKLTRCLQTLINLQQQHNANEKKLHNPHQPDT